MQYFNTFKNMVQEARGFSPIEIEKVANAKVFLAEESLKLKLIDAIGTKDLAIELISKRLEENNIKDLEVREVRPEPKRQQGFFDGIFTSAFKILTKIQANADIWNIQTILKY
jgi:ClpP class serine protease